jgi:hypothetical protein
VGFTLDKNEGRYDKVEMTVNGSPVSGEVEGRTLLVEFCATTCA